MDCSRLNYVCVHRTSGRTAWESLFLSFSQFRPLKTFLCSILCHIRWHLCAMKRSRQNVRDPLHKKQLHRIARMSREELRQIPNAAEMASSSLSPQQHSSRSRIMFPPPTTSFIIAITFTTKSALPAAAPAGSHFSVSAPATNK